MTTKDPLAKSGSILLPTDAETRRLGAALAGALTPGDALFLFGDLGAGKTTLARALIQTAIPDVGETPSPTFTIVQTYDGAWPIWHADLYRLADASELIELGLEDAFDIAICIVEWPERLGDIAPSRRLAISLRIERDDGRTADWRAFGDGWSGVAAVLEGFEEARP